VPSGAAACDQDARRRIGDALEIGFREALAQEVRNRSSRRTLPDAPPSRIGIGLVLRLDRRGNFAEDRGRRGDRRPQPLFLARLVDLPQRERSQWSRRELGGDLLRRIERAERWIARVDRIRVQRYRDSAGAGGLDRSSQR